MIEKAEEHNDALFILFLQKAYDSVLRQALWQVLEKCRVPPAMLHVIRAFHEGMCVQRFELATQPQTVLKYRMASDKDALWLLHCLTSVLVQRWQIGGVIAHELELA